MSSKEDGNSFGADETSLEDETGFKVSVELDSKVDISFKVKDLDSETSSEVAELKSKVNTSSKTSFRNLDLADEDLDFADGSLDSEDLDLEEGLDLEISLDFDGGGYWSGSND